MSDCGPLPEWLKRKKDLSELRSVKLKLRAAKLSTVCEEARCPNITECFKHPTATFLIMGDTCTRGCRFCAVKHGAPEALCSDEPQQVAAAARDLGLTHVVITSVTRDDLPDYGAGAFAATITAVRAELPAATIEVLTPDFMASREHLASVLAARPAVFNHNVEMVERLQPELRPGASLERSLKVLSLAKEIAPEIPVKSGFMVGFGETDDEIRSLMEKLHQSGCDILTIGQYMQPSREQVKAVCHHHPAKFTEWAELAKKIGIRYVVAGPLVRSSYQAKSALEGMN